jgi:hypothetical protein
LPTINEHVRIDSCKWTRERTGGGHIVIDLPEALANQAELAANVTATEGPWGIIAIEFPHSIRGSGYGGDINDETSNGLSTHGNWANGIARVFLKNLAIPSTPSCFRQNTMVETDQGEIEIQNITTDNTINNLKVTALTKAFNSDGMMAKITKGAINGKVPTKSLFVQKDHKLCLSPLEIGVMESLLWERTPKDEILYNILLEKPSYMHVNGMKVETLDPESSIAKYWLSKTQSDASKFLTDLEKSAAIANIMAS